MMNKKLLFLICISFLLHSLSASLLDKVLRPVDPSHVSPGRMHSLASISGNQHNRQPPRAMLDSQLILDAVAEAALPHFITAGKLNVQSLSVIPGIWINPEDYEIRVSPLNRDPFPSRMIVTFEVWSEDKRLGRWQHPFEFEYWSPVWIAKQRLRRGDRIPTSVVQIEKRNLLAERIAPIDAETDISELEVTGTIIEGNPLTWRDVQQRPAVKRGQTVEVTLQTGTLSINLPALATQDGHTGDYILLRNIQSKKEFYGLVTANSKVQVTLE